MIRLPRAVALLAALLPAAALGQAAAPTPAPPSAPPPPPAAAPPPAPAAASPAPIDPMAAWTPRKVTPAQERAARQQILALLQRMDQASRKGDLEAAVAMVDFPVLMLTDTRGGDGLGGPWTEAQWRKEMAPLYQPAGKDQRVTHDARIFLISSALASVDDRWTMTTAERRFSGRTGMLLIRKQGAWKVKAMAEGGWGDVGDMGAGPPPPEGAGAAAK